MILDVDGTVATCPYDFEAMRQAVTRAAARWGVNADELPERGIIERIALVAERLGGRAAGFREEAEAAVCELEVAAAQGAGLLPGAAEALAALRRQGLKIGLITRNCRAAAARALSGLREYDLLLTREDVPLAKPDPDHVVRCAGALGCQPEHTAVVGDHAFDMQAGRAAGALACIGVRTGPAAGGDAALLAAGADVILDSLADLPEWLAHEFGGWHGDVSPTARNDEGAS